jgi:methionyl-tRNA formyltransferase
MRFAVIGSGKVAANVCSHLLASDGAVLACVIADPRHETAYTKLADLALSQGIPFQETPKLDAISLKLLREADLDYLVSANNHLILKRDHLAAARHGAVNFHNGPLPRYAGLNTCSWALLNGETAYGVTWHLMDEGIDTGDIIRQAHFAIEPDEGAIELIARCIDFGLELFPAVLQDLLDKNVNLRVQNLDERTYFGLRDRPWNGAFPFWAPRSELLRLAKALAFWPMPNLFYKPRISLPDFGDLYASRFDYSSGINGNWDLGRAEPSDDGIIVAVDGGSAYLSELVDARGMSFDQRRLPERTIFLHPQKIPTLMQAE